MYNIGVFLDSFHIGGVQKVFITLANEWKRIGCNVIIITINDNGELKEEVNNSINVIDLKCTHIYNAFFKIPKVLRKYKIDILLTGKDGVNIFFIINKLFFCFKTKLFISQHNYLVPERSSMQRFYQIVMLRGIKWLYKKADGVICVSNGIKEALTKNGIGEEKLCIIYNPLDISQIRNKSQEVLDDVPANFLMFCGRFSPVKNLSYLIRSFAVFLDTNPDYKLIMVGDGSIRTELYSLVNQLGISNSVVFTGALPNPYVYMKESKLVLLSSYNEAFPTVVLEALSLGKTVVSTASGGPNEILQNDKGFIVNSFDDTEQYARIMKFAIDHPIPELYLKEYSETFSKEYIAKKYLNCFGNVINK